MNWQILTLVLSLTCVCCHLDWSDGKIDGETIMEHLVEELVKKNPLTADAFAINNLFDEADDAGNGIEEAYQSLTDDISEEEEDGDWSNDMEDTVDDRSDAEKSGWFKLTNNGRTNKNCHILPKPCPISLPQDSSKTCTEKRLKDITIARNWYQLTDETQTSKITFPFKQIPWLNRTKTEVGMFFAQDEFESRYIVLAKFWQDVTEGLIKKLEAKFGQNDLYTYQEYKDIYNAFDLAVQNLHNPKNFDSYTSDPTYFNVVENDQWQEDDYFVQNLMTSTCPWLIRKVTKKGNIGMKASDLKEKLNANTELIDAALSSVYSQSITLDQAINKGRLFVLYHKSHDGMASFPDILDRDADDTRTMKNTTSPITLFILNKAGHLKLATIQWDSTPDSPVYTRATSTNHQWLLAKGMASVSNLDVCQFKFHLGHMHFTSFVFCLTFRRHFSDKHPLYDILKFHCEGTVPQITMSYDKLSAPEEYGHQLFSVSYQGVEKLAKEAYEERKYGMFDFHELLKTKGLDDKRIKYNPFREDAQLIWDEFVKFADDVVEEFYKNDRDVQQDEELQSYVNEVSIDGKGPNGGKGKYIGLPAEFTSRDELKKFLVSFLWISVIHTTVNYNLAPSYVPVQPMKLYTDTQSSAAGSYPHDLSDLKVTVAATGFAGKLAYFRANRIMKYHDKVQSKELKKIVLKSHNRLHGCIEKELSGRNAKRKSLGQPGLQVLQPKWLTNSIHI